MMKDKISTINCCIIMHLALFLAVVHLVLTRASVLQIMEFVLDTFEIIFSPLLLDNQDMLLDASTKALAIKVLAIFMVTAMPAYLIAYPLFSRFYKIDYDG